MLRRRTIAGALVALLLSTGAAKAQDDARPAAEPPNRASTSAAKPFAAFSASAAALRDSIVALARAQVGTRYVLGGSTPGKGFDCSGLIRYIMAKLDIELPRTANRQARVGEPVPKRLEELRPGDLLTFGSPNRVSHIGIYVGDGKFVHASSVAGRVVERPFNPNLRGQKPWVGVRRLLALSDADSTTTEPASVDNR